MRIRKYNGKDMQEALAKVRADLGVEAVILNSRKVKRRGIAAWFSKPYFEVLAAVEENFIPSIPPSQSRKNTADRRTDAWRDTGIADLPPLRPEPVSGSAASFAQANPLRAHQTNSTENRSGESRSGEDAVRPVGRYGAAAYAVARDKTTDMLDPAVSAPRSAHSDTNQKTGKGTDELEQLKQQVQSMAVLLERLQTGMPDAMAAPVPQATPASPVPQATPASPVPQENPARSFPQAAPAASHATAKHATLPLDPLVEAFVPFDRTMTEKHSLSDGNPPTDATMLGAMRQRLLDQEVDPPLADRILGKVRDLLPSKASAEDVRKQTERVLAAALGEPETIRLRQDGKPCVVAFVGPTGVGKTTTLAKIAADFSLVQGKKVGLVTADTYRIAAVEQLKTYAEILNLPVTVVYSPSDMPAAIKAHQDKDLILIDTAGRSHRNRQQFDELRQLLQAVPYDEVFLVLSVNTGRAACQEVLEHYAFVREYKLLFTKLDETPVPGIIINARLRTGKRLSYVTAGQSVPDDLSVADPRSLAVAASGSGA